MLKFMINAQDERLLSHSKKYIHFVIKTMNCTQETDHRNAWDDKNHVLDCLRKTLLMQL